MHSRLTPKFSVITVTRNARPLLEDTIQSVISQTYRHVEYIIVDGGSHDGTLALIGKYRERIACVVSEPDRGLYDAMNKGIRLATGDYVCFLNAGDALHEEDTLQQDREGHFVRMRRLSAPETLTWKSFRQGMLVCHQAFFAKRSLAGPYDLQYRFSADFDWCIRVMKKARTLHNTRLTLIDYLDEGMTTRNRKASLRERFRIMARHYGLISTVLHHAWFVVRLMLKK